MSSETPQDPLLETLQSLKTIPWVNLPVLDLSLYDSPNGKQELATQLTSALHGSGFLAIKNFGISKESIQKQIKIAESFFDLPLEEKLPFHDAAAWAKGERVGYRPIGSELRKIQFQGKHRDNAQVYNIERVDGFHDQKHPPVVQENLKKLEEFQREVNEKVGQKLLRLTAIGLRLPDENHLSNPYDFSQKGEDILRYIHFAAIPITDSEANDGIYASKHTDLGTLTLNFCQPIAGLQILDKDGEWKWVKPWDEGTVVVNCADALSAMTGGWLKSGLHRVHAPPKEQVELDRVGVLWFARPGRSTIMESIKGSSVLEKEKLGVWEGVDEGLTGEEWIQVWQKHLKRQDEVEAEKKRRELEER